jgi:hypothetical protein
LTTYPRLHSELVNPDETTSTQEADYRDYTAITEKLRNGLPFVTVGSTAGCDYVTDGTTDNLQNAIDDLSSGGVIFLKDGTYTVNTSLTMKTNIALLGVGWATILKAKANLNSPVFLIDTINNWSIRNLQVDGNKSQQNDQGHQLSLEGAAIKTDGIAAYDCQNWNIENCYIHDCRTDGIETGTNTTNSLPSTTKAHATIQNNLVYQCCANCVDVYQPYIDVVNNTIINFCDVGIDLGSANCLISGNKIVLDADLASGLGYADSYWGIGIEFPYIGGLISDNIIDFSAFPSADDNANGIVASDSCGSYVNFINNSLIGNTLCYAGYILYTPGNSIIGGLITGFKIGYSPAIQLRAGSDGTVINGVNIYNNNRCAMIYTTASNIKVINCQFSSNNSSVLIGDQNGHLLVNPTVSISNCLGYNPIGAIADPIHAADNIISDKGGDTATFTSGTTYTNSGSSKTLYISGGTVTAIVHNGVTLATSAATITLFLQPTDTFSVTFSSAPTIVVMGQ